MQDLAHQLNVLQRNLIMLVTSVDRLTKALQRNTEVMLEPPVESMLNDQPDPDGPPTHYLNGKLIS